MSAEDILASTNDTNLSVLLPNLELSAFDFINSIEGGGSHDVKMRYPHAHFASPRTKKRERFDDLVTKVYSVSSPVSKPPATPSKPQEAKNRMCEMTGECVEF